jgi:hypothetical protein
MGTGTFAETANVDYRLLLLADQEKQTSIIR